MKLTKFYFLILSMISFSLFTTSCNDDDDCMTVCETNEILSSDCECVTINTGPCEGITCPDGEVLTADCDCITEETATEVFIGANITENTTWTSDLEVILGGRITVVPGVTLTIEPGTIIKGQAGAGANSSVLVVARGATIEACGTAVAPIIFTSVADEITPTMVAAGNFGSPNLEPDVNGLWGGLILLGNAPISAQNDNDMDIAELQIEGIPATDPSGLYGGDDANDSSGSLCYISLRHGGTNIGEGNEINGITFGGVGSGTTVNNIEIVANQDDGVEWFGGTCSATNVLVWNCGDDGLDTDQAWNGTCDNWIVALPQGGSAMELDGPEGTLTQGCNTFVNGTIYSGTGIDHIIDWDDSTNTGISNIYIFGVDADYDPSVGIESFGGNGECSTGTWEYTVPAGYDADGLFADAIGAGQATAVSANGNSVGADSSAFSWTWGAQSGTLSSIGL